MNWILNENLRTWVFFLPASFVADFSLHPMHCAHTAHTSFVQCLICQSFYSCYIPIYTSIYECKHCGAFLGPHERAGVLEANHGDCLSAINVILASDCEWVYSILQHIIYMYLYYKVLCNIVHLYPTANSNEPKSANGKKTWLIAGQHSLQCETFDDVTISYVTLCLLQIWWEITPKFRWACAISLFVHRVFTMQCGSIYSRDSYPDDLSIWCYAVECIPL